MLTILGKTSSAISMIADNMQSINFFPKDIVVINNLKLPDDLPYKNPFFSWYECEIVNENHSNFIIGSTDQKVKQKIFDLFKIEINKFINCIHNSSEISTTSELGKGIIINSLSSICAYSTIGNFVTINRNASIGHHSVLEDFVTIAPSATICGKVKISKGTFIGAGAIIRDGVSIGENCIIGCGSVVVKDVPSNTKGFGNPFKSQ